MPTERFLIIGAGGHARVVYEALRQSGYTGAIEVRDDDLSRQGLPFEDVRIDTPALPPFLDPAAAIHVALGDNRMRRTMLARVVDGGATPATVVHPRAVTAAGARIGDGTLVAAGCIVGPGSELGAGCIVNHGAIVDHDCVMRNWCHAAPGAVLGGGVRVEEGVLIGAGAVILPGCTIGAWAVVGAGAVVTADVAENVTVTGVPARVSKPK